MFCFINSFLLVYKQDVIELCRNRKQDSPKPVYKDRPLPSNPSTSNPSNQEESMHRVLKERQFTSSQGSQHQDTPLSSPPNPHRLKNTAHEVTGANHTAHTHNGGAETVINGHHYDDVHIGPISVRSPPTSIPSGQSTECRDVSAMHADGTETANGNPSSEQTISQSSFGCSDSDDAQCRPTYNRAQSLQSSANNPKPLNASGHVKRTKSENTAIVVENPLPRRNAVRENKQGSGWHGDYNADKSGHAGQSSSTNGRQDYGTPTSPNSSVPHDQAIPECNTLTPNHEPIWRRLSEEPNQQLQDQPSAGRETEINGGHFYRQRGRKNTANRRKSSPSIHEPSQKTEVQPPQRTAAGQEETNPWCALILLVPVRLGGDEVNPIYVTPLRTLFTLRSCMGIIGGKPKHSLYYVGFQGR